MKNPKCQLIEMLFRSVIRNARMIIESSQLYMRIWRLYRCMCFRVNTRALIHMQTLLFILVFLLSCVMNLTHAQAHRWFYELCIHNRVLPLVVFQIVCLGVCAFALSFLLSSSPWWWNIGLQIDTHVLRCTYLAIIWTI